MCGRYTINIGRRRFETVYQVQAPLEFETRYNVAPTQTAPIIVQGHEALEASMMRWGFQRPNQPQPLINARGETVRPLPTFASSFRSRRCLVPATGWYEWQTVGGKKQPYSLSGSDQEPLAFAGIWTPSETGERFSIITSAANLETGHIHHRQLVIIARERWRIWLADSPLSELEAMLEPEKAGRLDFYPVGTRVGSVKNDDESLLQRMILRDEGDVLLLFPD
jgi:putative SOS response-associated peptidase YedK